MLKKLRVALALIFWVCITILFLDLTGAIRLWLGWMAQIQFLPAVLAMNVGVVVLWVVVTLLVGRIYCSVICPLGVFQDAMIHIADWVTRKTTKSKLGRYHFWGPKWSSVLRISIFAVFVIALVALGGTVAMWLAPYSIYGRMVTSLLRPLTVWSNNQLADMAAAQESYAFYHVAWAGTDLAMVVIAVVTAIVLMACSFFGGRFYCNTICPVGTCLGFLSRKSLIRVQIDASKCAKCGLCERKCKSMAIDAKSATIDNSKCVDCFNCLDACLKDAISFGLAKNNAKAEAKESKDTQSEDGTSRRAFIATAVTLAVASQLKAEEKTVDGVLGVIEDKKRYKRETEICPPGAGSWKNFQQHCTGCQLCVTACPNEVLRPNNSSLLNLQPVMSYENGHCRPECHACSDICPVGAIKSLGDSHEEKMARKSSLKIGRAVWIKDNCVPLSDGNTCGNCARHCPTGAISMIPSDPNDPKSIKIPSIDEERCIGCGACEHLCPSRPFSAIHVEGIEVQREI